MTRKGNISVNTQDIFPIIKRWLYSEHDIFLRELVSNASDAIQKRSILSRSKNVEIPAPEILVEVDKSAKTLTIHDNGIGMTEEEVEKYLAQLAFSGAKEFAEKMKDLNLDTKNDIIGKFGLGFYSAFMVAKQVEVETLSQQENAVPTKWLCDGSSEYTFEESSRKTVGTSITLHINDESEEFLEFFKIRSVLTKYCDFMVHPIFLYDSSPVVVKEGEEAPEKKEKEQINEHQPLWKKDPSTLKDQDYIDFYRKLYPMDPEPLFWLHLRVDHPFDLQGILFFPKLNPNKPLNEKNIKLYSKQVYVSDNVKAIVPEFLGLLKGSIDSTDIPLNVSRSALQGDPNIQKISNYIIKKVSESLKKLFKNDRPKYENAWSDIGLFVKYGAVSEDKFDEVMRPYVLYKDLTDKLHTLEEFEENVPEEFKEKLKGKVLYYETNKVDHHLKEQLLKNKIPAAETDGYIDPHFMQKIEFHKVNDKTYKFTSIDTEIESLLSEGEENKDSGEIKDLFDSILCPKKENEEEKDKTLAIEVKGLRDANGSAYFKVDEQSKRLQQMTKTMGQGMDIPLKKTLVINPNNALVKNALKIWQKGDNKGLAEKMCLHVKDLASFSSENLTNEQKAQFVQRSQDIIQELSKHLV